MVIAGGSGAGTTYYSYDDANELTGYTDSTGRAVALGYDSNGNRVSRTVSGGSDNGTDTYSYDFENRLIGLVKGTAGNTGTYSYTYDYRTRRIVRDESSAGGATTAIVFSGGSSVQEYDNGASTPTVENIRGSDYGGGVGGILYTLRTVSGTLTPSYTHENKRGDVVLKTDGSGTATYQAQYQAFGQQVATSGTTLDRQKSNSKDTDPTGLVDEGHRYRDLDTGMFITRDPAGFVDGPNLYTYVIQNPWTSFDPEGLAADDENSKRPAQHPVNRASVTKQNAKQTEPSSSVKKTYDDNKKQVGGNESPPPAAMLKLNLQSQDEQSAQAAQAFGLRPPSTKSTESNGLNTEGAGNLLDAAGFFTAALAGKIGITYSTGEMSLYAKEAARGSRSYGIMANLAEVGRAGGVAVTVGSVAVDSYQGHYAQAGVDAGLGYAAFKVPAIGLPLATGVLAFDVGKIAQGIPSGNKNDDTIGQAMEKGTQGLIAPRSVEWSPFDVLTRTDQNGTPY